MCARVLRVRVTLSVSVRVGVTVCEYAACVNGHVSRNVECLHVRLRSVCVCVCWNLHLCFLASAVERT